MDENLTELTEEAAAKAAMAAEAAVATEAAAAAAAAAAAMAPSESGAGPTGPMGVPGRTGETGHVGATGPAGPPALPAPAAPDSSSLLSSTIRIIIYAMVVVMVALGFAIFTVSSNASSTQKYADAQRILNEQLTSELECLRIPQFEADEANAQLDILVARGLANLDDSTAVEAIREELIDAADNLELRLEAREESLTSCKEDPPRIPNTTTP